MFRNGLMIAAAAATLAAVPVYAKPGGGNGNGGGAGMGGMHGPPMMPPGRMGGGNASSYARDIASQRGQFGRDWAQQRRDAAAARRAARPIRTAEDAKDLLENDMQDWREQHRIGRAEWQALRNQWLADKGNLTREEWLARRNAWFQARNTWIANQRLRARGY